MISNQMKTKYIFEIIGGNMSILELKNVSKSYNGRKIIDNFTLFLFLKIDSVYYRKVWFRKEYNIEYD